MNDVIIKQGTRLGILLVDVAILSIASRLAVGQWLPPVGVKGFWFYAAVLSLVLGSRLITPFYTKPVDAVSYAIPALIALFLVNDWATWTADEKMIFSFAVVYCTFLVMASFVAILTKDSDQDNLLRLSNSLRMIVDVLGSPRAIFSVLILFALYLFHRESEVELLWIGIAWALTVALSPVEWTVRLAKKLRYVWLPGYPDRIVGTVAAYQNPGIVLIRQTRSESVGLGHLLFIKDPHAPSKIGITIGYVGRDEGMLLRAIEVDASPKESASKLLGDIPNNAVVRVNEEDIEKPDQEVADMLTERNLLVGIVAPETSIERLYFEVVKDDEMEEGRLVETFIGGNRVLYQVVNGFEPGNTRSFPDNATEKSPHVNPKVSLFISFLMHNDNRTTQLQYIFALRSRRYVHVGAFILV